VTDKAQNAEAPRPVVLCILDGWGHRTERENNAIALADTPTWDRWMADSGFPHALVETSGGDVGLPAGQMGNSEVGHMNIGAGRVVLQDLPQIDATVKDGSLATRAPLTRFISTLKDSGGTCHLMGLLSPGGVHSHQDHMVALAKAVSEAGVPVRIHAFLDGRDTAPQSARDFAKKLLADIDGFRDVTVATAGGRYYAMDRDNRWDRVEKAYGAIVEGNAAVQPDLLSAIDKSYADGTTDEFVEPIVINGYTGMADGDGLLMANFRADRARQLLMALLASGFDDFKRQRVINFAAKLGMTEYSSALADLMDVLFPAETPEHSLGEVVAEAGLNQLRIAETEKYAHVTFFLNGGTEREFNGESRILVPSPKVATYDLQPEMAAPEVTDKLVDAIASGRFDLIVVNYANGDMVGHTGVLPAAIKAAETIDTCLGRLENAVSDAGGVLLVTADHGNCEMMTDPESGKPHTAHTVGKVPVVMVNGPRGALHDGRLADLAPTVLDLMALPQPDVMTGRSLLDRDAASTRRAAE
jgi:2,3-bisphosphoglycerate-independent phosphoglycerate mutase